MKKPLTLLILLLGLGLYNNAQAMTDNQLKALYTAEEMGADYGLGDLTAAVIGQESSYCKHKKSTNPRDKNRFGCGQLSQRTVKDAVGVLVPKKVLKDDNSLNIYFTVRVLADCHSHYPDMARTLYCYNHGVGAAKSISLRKIYHSKYFKSIVKRLQEVRDWNMMLDQEIQ